MTPARCTARAFVSVARNEPVLEGYGSSRQARFEMLPPYRETYCEIAS